MTEQGRRRRKRRPDYSPPPRRGQAKAEEAAKAETPPVRRRGGRPERPPAPWGRFPLVELVVLLAIVMVVAGFVMQGTRGGTFIVTGLALGSLAGLEVSIREHFAGHKSHTLVLAGVPTVIIIGLGLFLLPAGWPRVVALLTAVLVFLLSLYLLREAFRRRSGGLTFR
jgi:hypothetical protein